MINKYSLKNIITKKLKTKKMEKTKLKLLEVLQLNHEINGFTNTGTSEVIYEGFLRQNLSILLKYNLTGLSEFLLKETKKIESLRDELIKKYGTEENGSIFVKMYLEDVVSEDNDIKTMNPKYLEFEKEYSELLNGEIDVEYEEISKDELKEAGKTKDQYRVLFKLIKKD
jgi:hypothetical protein